MNCKLSILITTIFFCFRIVLTTNPWTCPSSQTINIIPTTTKTCIPFCSDEPEPYEANVSCIWNLTIPLNYYLVLDVQADMAKGDVLNISNLFENQGSDFLGQVVPLNGENRYYFPLGNTIIYFVACQAAKHKNCENSNNSTGRLSFAFYAVPWPLLSQVTIDILENGAYYVEDLSVLSSYNIQVTEQTTTYVQVGIASDASAEAFDSCFIEEISSGIRSILPLNSCIENAINFDEPTVLSIYCLNLTNPALGSLALSAENIPFKWLLYTGVNTIFAVDSDTTLVSIICPENCAHYVQFVTEDDCDNPGLLTISVAHNMTLPSVIQTHETNCSTPIATPMELQGSIKIFRFEKYPCTVIVDMDSEDFRIPRPGRRGFVMSQGFGVSSKDQTFSRSFSVREGSPPLEFSIYSKADINDEGVITVVPDNDVSQQRTWAYRDSCQTKVRGSSILIDYMAKGEVSAGAIVYFEVTSDAYRNHRQALPLIAFLVFLTGTQS